MVQTLQQVELWSACAEIDGLTSGIGLMRVLRQDQLTGSPAEGGRTFQRRSSGPSSPAAGSVSCIARMAIHEPSI